MGKTRRTTYISRIIAAALAVAIAFCGAAVLCACGAVAAGDAPISGEAGVSRQAVVSEDGEYSGKEEVAAYLHEYGHLPGNYISKTAARKAGWNPSEGNLDDVCPGKSIGGSVFHNDDGQLPAAAGRTWKECDIGYEGGFRGPERIVFSNDGLIYYTGDHYKSYERLY